MYLLIVLKVGMYFSLTTELLVPTASESPYWILDYHIKDVLKKQK